MSDDLLRGRPLSNVTCPYCGTPIEKQRRTKEHVIGRRFVPVGTLENCWNLIVWACSTCNRRKSDLEDDIAAITMHFHVAGLPQMSDSRAQAEATRRGAKSASRKTGRPVAESHATLKFSRKLGNTGEVQFSFTAPPQLDDARVYELARLQIVGFFYFLTYDQTQHLGHYWPGGFFPVHGTIKSDWGNPVHRAFMREISRWDYRLILNTASGYYRAAIRRHPTADCWAWAVEWNDCYRLVGFFGDPAAARTLAESLPDLPVLSVREHANSWLRYRREEPLSEEDDTLFHIPPEAEA